MTLDVLTLPSWYPMHYAPMRGTFFQEQIQVLHSHGVRVGVIYPNLRRLRTIGLSTNLLRDHFQTTITVEEGVPVYRFHGWNPKSEHLRLRIFRWQSRRLMEVFMEKHGRPSLIHAHCARWGGVAARDLAKKYELPYVVTEHSSAYQRGKVAEWQKPMIRKCFEDAAAVWAVSNAFKQQLEPYAGDARVGVMPNMVDTDFFREPPQPRTKRHFTFLCIGSLTPNKGIDLLINSFSKVFSGDPSVRLIIGGDGPERRKLEQLTEDLRIDSQTQFYGVMSREEVRDAMWNANALVSASYIETFGIVLIEAMATGLPVVATRSGGPQDIVRPDVGRLVPTGDSDALAEALVQMVNNPFKESVVREYVTSTYSAEAFAERLIEQYQDITKGGIK